MEQEINFLALLFMENNFKNILLLLVGLILILYANFAVADADLGKKLFNKCIKLSCY